MQRILTQSERRLKKRGAFTEGRVDAMIDSYRRIARQVYATDRECFRSSFDAVQRLCPKYRPKKTGALIISSLIGFRNYEQAAAWISWRLSLLRSMKLK
jgi:hypothetical protein